MSSKTQDLKKQFPLLNITLLDTIRLIDPSGKSKYVELILRTMVAEVDNNSNVDHLLTHIANNDISIDIDHLDMYEKYVHYNNLFELLPSDSLKCLHDFHKLNERGLIPENDISNFKVIDDLKNQVNIAQLKMDEKSMEKEIIVVFRDDEWILVKPLTHMSSIKYGYNTKWCTAMVNQQDYFKQYSSTGILIYIINTKTGQKVGFFCQLKPGEYDDEFHEEVSFWSAEDRRVDSMEVNLPNHIINIIRGEYKENRITNWDLMGEELQAKENIYYEEKDSRKIPVTLPSNIREMLNDLNNTEYDEDGFTDGNGY